MKLLYPIHLRHRITSMLAFAFIGAMIGGGYGALHDQVSYTISPEYFTHMKFVQFDWADAGWPPRLFASIVGFLATWWVGMIAGWLLSRVGLDQITPADRRTKVACTAFAIMLLSAVTAGAIGAFIGWSRSRGDLRDWMEYQELLGLHDLPRFVIVAWLHGAGYVGALIGLVVALLFAWRKARTNSGEIPND